MEKHETKPNFAANNQVLDLQRLVTEQLFKMPKSRADEILRSNASRKAFMKEIGKVCKMPVQNERAQSIIPLLIDYYDKVYGIDISEISEMEFPDNEKFPMVIAVSPKHNEDQIMEAKKAYFKINIGQYKSPVAKNINRDEEARIQQRPTGLYLAAHTGEDEPDTIHRNKSYDDAVAAKMVFANAKEYLLMTGFHKFTKGYFMDKKGWTRTSSLWSDGFLVYGYWYESASGLYMNYGYRDYRSANFGPRELFLTL